MGTPYGAQRYGIDDDPVQLDLRLARLEAELLRRQLANVENTVQAPRVRSRSALPQVTGLALDNKIVGTVEIKWKAVLNPGLRSYEVQYAPDANFGPTSITSRIVSGGQTNLIIPTDLKDQVYVRVRAVGFNGQLGTFSNQLNIQTGEASVVYVGTDSASQIISDISWPDGSAAGVATTHQTDEGAQFYAGPNAGVTRDPAIGYEYWGDLIITTTQGGIVFTYTKITTFYGTDPVTTVVPAAWLHVRLERLDTNRVDEGWSLIDERISTINVDTDLLGVGNWGRVDITGWSRPDVPPRPGTYRYRLGAALESRSNDDTWVEIVDTYPTVMEFVEYKR